MLVVYDVYDSNNNYMKNTSSKTSEIIFSVSDQVLDSELSPLNVTLPLLAGFTGDVISFIKGEDRQDLENVKTRIQQGSLALVVDNSTGAIDSAVRDFQYIAEHRSINDIDPYRAKVVEKWQLEAKRNQGRTYHLFFDDGTGSKNSVVINGESNYQLRKKLWVNVDLYLYGKIFDLGGKNQPNVHIELENGTIVKIEAYSNLLAQDKENRLYKEQLVRIKAQRNLETKELRNEKLVSFEKYSPHFDEEEFNRIAKKASFAWSNVENASDWVENLRGGKDV